MKVIKYNSLKGGEMFKHIKMSTKVLLLSVVGLLVIAIGTLAYGQISGKFKISAEELKSPVTTSSAVINPDNTVVLWGNSTTKITTTEFILRVDPAGGKDGCVKALESPQFQKISGVITQKPGQISFYSRLKVVPAGNTPPPPGTIIAGASYCYRATGIFTVGSASNNYEAKNWVSFQTSDGKPVVTTVDYKITKGVSVDTNSAVLNGTINKLGSVAVNQYGFYLKEDTLAKKMTPNQSTCKDSLGITIADVPFTKVGGNPGSKAPFDFTTQALSLKDDTYYCFAASATNAKGTAYGSVIWFKTEGVVTPPVVTTVDVANPVKIPNDGSNTITLNGPVILRGNVNINGNNYAKIKPYFQYGELDSTKAYSADNCQPKINPIPITLPGAFPTGVSAGDFSAEIKTGLQSTTLYCYIAWADFLDANNNVINKLSGRPLHFKTPPPVVPAGPVVLLVTNPMSKYFSHNSAIFSGQSNQVLPIQFIYVKAIDGDEGNCRQVSDKDQVSVAAKVNNRTTDGTIIYAGAVEKKLTEKTWYCYKIATTENPPKNSGLWLPFKTKEEPGWLTKLIPAFLTKAFNDFSKGITIKF